MLLLADTAGKGPVPAVVQRTWLPDLAFPEGHPGDLLAPRTCCAHAPKGRQGAIRRQVLRAVLSLRVLSRQGDAGQYGPTHRGEGAQGYHYTCSRWYACSSGKTLNGVLILVSRSTDFAQHPKARLWFGDGQRSLPS